MVLPVGYRTREIPSFGLFTLPPLHVNMRRLSTVAVLFRYIIGVVVVVARMLLLLQVRFGLVSAISIDWVFGRSAVVRCA